MSFRIRFKIRSKKNATKTDPHYIYVRLRVDGVPAPDFAAGVSCLPSEWDAKSQHIKGYSELVRQQNLKLDQIRTELDTLYNELRKTDKTITAQVIKQMYTRKESIISACLLAYFDRYIEKELSGLVEESTLGTWQSKRNTLEGYIKTLHRKDVDLVEVTPKWLKGYHEYHLKTLGNCLNHAARAIQAVKKIIDYAVIEEALPFNATRSLKVARGKKKPIKYLTVDQIDRLAECPYYPERLQRVVDAFLFQCYTGMAYNEIRAFNHEKHVETDKDGITWIKIYRGKTNELCLIPLLHQARTLLLKYEYRMQIITNQKMNDFIKEAAQIANLRNWDKITTHVGRSTAGTFLLNKGVDIKIVSKILGHKSVIITESHYAELLTDTISRDLRKNGLI